MRQLSHRLVEYLMVFIKTINGFVQYVLYIAAGELIILVVIFV